MKMKLTLAALAITLTSNSGVQAGRLRARIQKNSMLAEIRELSQNGIDNSANTLSGGPDLAAFADIQLAAHNKYRGMHSTGPMVYDATLAAGCQEWAQHLSDTESFAHSTGGDYGENLAMNSDAVKISTTSNPTDMWYSEVKDYDFANPGWSHLTGHFTQVVWKASTKLGCGVAGMYVCCRYSPAGNMNMPGYFEDNVLPLGSAPAAGAADEPAPAAAAAPAAASEPVTTDPSYNSLSGEQPIGCFEDKPQRDLPHKLSGRCDIKHCFDMAIAQGYKYAGLQYKGECWGGNDVGTYGKKPDSDCSMPCKVDGSRTCGGAWRNEVFALPQ